MRQLLVPVTRPREVDVSMRARPGLDGAGTMETWGVAVSSASIPAIMLDAHGLIRSISRPATELLSTRVTRAIGRPVLELFTLVDFHFGVPTTEYAQRIPPLATIESGLLSRGLFRIRAAGRSVTIDAISAPLYDRGGMMAGSITFLSEAGAPPT